jgi:hypothetical protein
VTEEQKTLYVVFMANFVKLLYEENMPPAPALQAAMTAGSCLVCVVFGPVSRNDITEVENFTGPVISAAINSYYGVQADRAILN